MSHTVTENGIDVTIADEDADDRWDEYVARSDQGTAFHHCAALDVLAEHTGATIHPLVGYKGQEAIGIFPVFELSKGPFTAAFSPPPNLWIFYLGPALLNVEKLKQRKAEKRHRRFITASLQWLSDELDPKYVLISSHPRYADPRPFEWNDFETTPKYSYEVSLDDDPETQLKRFSRSARKNIEAAREAGVTVEEGNRSDIARIIEHVSSRHAQKDIDYTVTPAFVEDLYDALPDGRVRPYVATIDGEYASGMVTIEHDDAIDRWQGGAKPCDTNVAVNDLLDWHIMQRARERGRTRYDLNGANVPQLCDYKAKFDPDVITYYQLKRATAGADLLSKLYLKLR